MRQRFTASALSRARQCLYSFRDDVPLVQDTPGPAARLGTAFHKLAEAHIQGTDTTVTRVAFANNLPPSLVSQLRELWHAFLGWWPTAKGLLPWRAELPFAADVERGTARVTKMLRDRVYDAQPHEVVGRADAVAIDDPVVHVIDWKTGRTPIESAATNPQLRFLAACAMLAYGARAARVIVVRVGDTGLWSDEAPMFSSDIPELFDELALMKLTIPTSRPVPSKDIHGSPSTTCKWCPARGACPAWQEDLEPALRASLGGVA